VNSVSAAIAAKIGFNGNPPKERQSTCRS
jgi:hypothetical protein